MNGDMTATAYFKVCEMNYVCSRESAETVASDHDDRPMELARCKAMCNSVD